MFTTYRIFTARHDLDPYVFTGEEIGGRSQELTLELTPAPDRRQPPLGTQDPTA